ncbi:TPA: phage virion morphogenesis protein [Kluyvera cryocrescens]|nr:phage virion morphogenesis protein [Kluyvera cryocrescens]
MNAGDVHALDRYFADILAGASSSGRARTARTVGKVLRISQQQRIRAQRNPDGSQYPARRRKTLRTQQGIAFVWEGQLRRLKNWHSGRGKYGRTITGFDEDRNEIRMFYRADIERFTEINTRAGQRPKMVKAPMFVKLRTARFMKVKASSEGAEVGYSGMAARIARIHQYGLREQVGPGAFAKYAPRVLLGISKADEALIRSAVINSLGSAGA